ncbi:hypothetical protein [Hyalangium rubrum]|uniref:Uncharacterized protein n=1 Tax=Hyalangium rubrum TaxID=3103134 RepID=A0ABU5H3W7_9BACT|nr:hypothetical protein [Hyalangium sp. s54d21]MDY7228153.1 hypothetical protein [Hyalangium sp. s54d21]
MNKTNTTAQTTNSQELRAPDSFNVEVKSGIKAGRGGAVLVAEPA